MPTKPRSILITGAGSGIGRGLAERAAADGWGVVLLDLDRERVEQAAEAIRQQGGIAAGRVLDITDPDAVEQCFADGFGDLPPVEVLINNAGLQHVAALTAFPHETWKQLIDVMLIGAATVTRAALGGMISQGRGRIVNIGSIHSLVASPYKSAYTAAKHGLLGFAKTVALETATYDITINTICPSYVKTPLVEKQIADQAKQHGIPESEVVDQIMLKPMPKGVFISEDEIYGILQFLLSDAARNITGQTITVDGGWTIQ